MTSRGVPFLLVAVILSACASPALLPTATPTAEEVTINSRQAAIEAMESFLLRETGTSPEDYYVKLDETGLLTNAYIASVQRKDCSFGFGRYLIARSGEITHLSLDQLVMAYIRGRRRSHLLDLLHIYSE